MVSFKEGIGSEDKCMGYPTWKQDSSTEKKGLVWFHVYRLGCWDVHILISVQLCSAEGHLKYSWIAKLNALACILLGFGVASRM